MRLANVNDRERGNLISDDQDRWRLRVRRAFQVPDPVTDANARRSIAYELTHEAHIFAETTLVAAAEALIDAFVVVATMGEMDDELFDEALRPALSIIPAPDWLSSLPAQRVIARAVTDGMKLTSTPINSDDIFKMATRLVRTVTQHVHDWPVENASGDYGPWPD
jgi:hypothetical protein